MNNPYYGFKQQGNSLYGRYLVMNLDCDGGITVLNNILLIISRSRLSVAQPSSSFKRLDTSTFMYATPTL